MISGSDFTAASHVVFIVACGIGARRMIVLSRDLDDGRVSTADPAHLALASVMTLGALGVERFYYFSARMLSPDINLWELHPAPEMLSLFVAFYIVNESHASLKKRGLVPRLIRRARYVDFTVMAIAWLIGLAVSGVA